MIKMNKYLMHKLISSIFDIILFASASTGIIVYLSFIGFEPILLTSIIIFVILISFIIYTLYRTIKKDFYEYKKNIIREISEINSEIIFLAVVKKTFKSKKNKILVNKQIQYKKEQIKELKKEIE
jgi:hypothetical protein